MTRLLAALCAAGIACTSVAAEAPLHVTNLAGNFAQFRDATRDLPPAARGAQFKQVIGARYHGARTQSEQDAAIAHALDRFGSPRMAYLATVAADLAPRRGYYLGYLVAQEVGRTRDLHALAALDCADAHRLVVETVQRLPRQSAPLA